MFFALSKILDVLFSPLTWAILLCFAGVTANAGRLVKWGPLGGALILLVFSLEPVSNSLMRWTEQAAERTYREGVTYDAVIVLGGLLDHRVTDTAHVASYNDGVERLLTAYDLLREGKAAHVILSGGTDDPSDPVVEAEQLARQLRNWGVAPERLVIEGTSRNTRENAAESARLVRQRHFSTLLLVTSAAHMPRALSAFRAEGLSPDALPVDYRSFDPERSPKKWLPRANALSTSSAALRELVGRAVYSITGIFRGGAS